MNVEAIKKFTHHLTTCEKSVRRMVSDKCTCGLDQVLVIINQQAEANRIQAEDITAFQEDLLQQAVEIEAMKRRAESAESDWQKAEAEIEQLKEKISYFQDIGR